MLNLIIQDLEELLQMDMPEVRRENQRTLLASIHKQGYPTGRYLAWANCGRAGTIDLKAYFDLTSDNIKRESLVYAVSYVSAPSHSGVPSACQPCTTPGHFEKARSLVFDEAQGY